MEKEKKNGDNSMKYKLQEGILTKSQHRKQDQVKNSAHSGYYVLTRGSLECYHSIKLEKLKRTYPLAIISSVYFVHDVTFCISLPAEKNLLLDARDQEDCMMWVESIENGVQLWHCNVGNNCGCDTVAENVLFPCNTFPSLLSCSQISSIGKSLQVFGDFRMIKYARNCKNIPHERILKLDFNYMHVMWKNVIGFLNWTDCLYLNDVTEVRCGQQTENFNLFPYVEVEKQSFSLLFPKDQGEWCGLSSLDMICDSVLAFQHWKEALEILIYGKDGKQPYCMHHKIADPIIVFLKRHWSLMAEKDSLSLDAALQFLWKFNQTMKKKSLRNYIRNTAKKAFSSSENISWDCFISLFNLISRQTQLFDHFKKYARSFPDLGMTAHEFQSFLRQEQKVGEIEVGVVCQLIEHHDKENLVYKRMSSRDDPTMYRNSGKLLSFHGFVSFLRSADNPIVDVNQKQDMSKPLSSYFINSSHNTYLVSGQIKGTSSSEAYVYALQMGCRCLEIDCWDGQDEPIVTHGRTWTSSIPLRNILEIIKVYGFDYSPYPIILSLENHCSPEQQVVMAALFTEIFGDMLATENLCEGNVLPSPEQLKYKVILKGKVEMLKKPKVTTKFAPVRKRSRAATKHNLESYSTSVLNDDKIDGDQVVSEVPLEASMGRLIVYCIAVTYKHGEWNENCCEVHSFSETDASALAEKHPQDLLHLSHHKLLRTYPKASRIDSTNYNPMQMWSSGIQLAAINVQKPDLGFHVNNGFFMKSFGTGYVLKHPSLVTRDSTYHPSMTNNPNGENVENLSLEIVCGQFVDMQQFVGSSVVVEVELIGVEADCDSFTTEPCENILSPVWKKNAYNVYLVMPSLCLMYIRVCAVGRITKTIYQNCLPVDCLRPGLRYIPMKTLTGVERKENGIFVVLDIQSFSERRRYQSDVAASAAMTSSLVRSRSLTL